MAISDAGALPKPGDTAGMKDRAALAESIHPFLPTFVACSANSERYPELTLKAAQEFPSQILALLDRNPAFAGKDPVQTSTGYFGRGCEWTGLEKLLQRYGSDKWSHRYTPVYAKILAALPREDMAVLEIGLGTNEALALSTMGTEGKPGASARAFRDYLPEAEIYGADIDTNILFTEERIMTAHVDQLDPASFDTMLAAFGRRDFSLIIDDGLHSPAANLNTLLFGLRVVKDGGYIVIEDIAPAALPVWQIVSRALSAEKYETFLLRGISRAGSMYVVRVLPSKPA